MVEQFLSDPQYKVVIEGELVGDISPEQAAENIASLFKIPAARALALVSSGKVAIKQDLPEGAARKYVAALKRAGVAASIEPMSAPESTGTTAAQNSTSNDAPPSADQDSDLEILPQEGYILKEGETPPEATPPALELDHLSLAPEGSDMVEEQYRKPPPPDIKPPEELSLVD